MMGNKIRGAKVTQPLNLLQGGHNACKAVRRIDYEHTDREHVTAVGSQKHASH